MSKPTYLYRAVSIEPHKVSESEWDDFGVESAHTYTEPAGMILGRQSGYLSRSAAVDAGERSGLAYEIVRSEPVVFLTYAERLRKQIRELTAELAAVEAVA